MTYEDSLEALEQAAKCMRDAAVLAARTADPEDHRATEKMMRSAEICRAYLLAALRAAPGLADVYVVPAR